MEYAAVIIPTLNRLNHLQRCVNSLKCGDYASKTDLYISVDYPPSKRYEEGYSDVKKYVQQICGFLNVYVYFQDKNLGPGLNRKFLEEKISDKHDKYIFTDDDNEFSKNFLQYMNWGLEEFKDDESVYAICSCTDFALVDAEKNEDYFMIPAYNPYGSGHWLHKNRKCADFLQQESLDKIYRSKDIQSRLAYYSPMIYQCVALDSLRKIHAMRGKNDTLTYIDICENAYIIITGKKCIKPVVPKSRNWGCDGSGVHVASTDRVDFVPSVSLDAEESWKEAPARMKDENEKSNIVSHRLRFEIENSERRKCEFLYFLNGLLGNKFIYGLYRLTRNIYKKFFAKKEKSEMEITYG